MDLLGEIKAAQEAPLANGSGSGSQTGGQIIVEALDAVRRHFDMPVAYLSEFVGDQSVFRTVSAPGLEHLIKAEDAMPLEDIYCPKILSGALPNLIPDTSKIDTCMAMEITHQVPIGSHISLPIHREDGSVYGMFCCLSPTPNTSLNARDLEVMAMYANLAAKQIRYAEADNQASEALRRKVDDMLKSERFYIAYQPLVDLATGECLGFEALSRFESDPYQPPNEWFFEAEQVDLGLDLEVMVLMQLMHELALIPENFYVSFNASPDLISDPRFDDVLKMGTAARLILEVNEAQDVTDPDKFFERLKHIRKLGYRIAVDDVGAGYSGLQRIAQAEPDMLKIDRSITENVDASLAKRAVVAALVHLATETRATVLVEGVERIEEADALRELGVTRAQGWLFGRPAPIADVLKAFG